MTRSIARFRPNRASFKGLIGRSFAGACIMAIRGRMTLGVGSVTATAHVTTVTTTVYNKNYNVKHSIGEFPNIVVASGQKPGILTLGLRYFECSLTLRMR